MTITAGKDDLTLYKGGVLNEHYTYENEDDAGNSVIVDLTGYTAAAHAKDDNTGTVIFDLTTENGGITLGGANGTIVLYMAATATDDVTADCGIWQLKLIPPSGAADAFILLKGSVCVVKEA